MSIQDVARAATPRRLLAVLLSLGCAACGGGGGGSPPAPPPPPPPTPLTLSLSTNALTFSTVAPHTTAPTGVDVTAMLSGTFTQSGLVVFSLERDNPSIATIGLSAGQNPGQGGPGTLLLGTVRLGSPLSLTKRAHTATIRVCAAMGVRSCQTDQIAGSPQVLVVTYNVGGIEPSTTALSFTVANGPTAADLAQTFDVIGHLVPSWTATTSAPWLGLAPSSGDATAPTTVTASLNPSAIDALENGSYAGTITIASEGAPRSIAVALTLQRTRVNYVAPYIARANVAAEVIVRGENFTQFAPTSVEFGPGNVASAFTVDSNTQIRATHPALPAGSYEVRVVDNARTAPSRAQLVVVEPPPFTLQSLQYPGGPGVTPTSLIYDAERSALLVGLMRSGLPRIARFAYAGAWNLPTDVSVPSLNPGAFTAAALSTDGSALFVAYDDTSVFQFALAELDPVTLGPTKVSRYPAEIEGESIAVANNGRAIIKSERLCCSSSYPVLSYNPLNSSLTVLQNPFVTLNAASVGGSGDGSTILVATDDSSSPLVTPLLRYDSEQGTLVDSTGDIESLSPRIVLNRRGTHMLVRDLNGLQLLLTAPPNTVVGTLVADTLDAAFSPTAEILFGYDNTETLTAYDLTTGAPLVPSLTIAGTGSGAALVTVSPDGSTVFVAGDQQLAVVPASLLPQ